MVNLILTMNFKNYIADIFDFVLKRVLELMGIILIFLSILLGIALGSYSPDDPNFIFRENLEIKNYPIDFVLKNVDLFVFLVGHSAFEKLSINKELYLDFCGLFSHK